ncbi:hypothetical protein CTEN210_02984 [Chaetoceros tenuissimus]|uniref:Uncharacterized protein n=1 Tax=Chaetoceros tenuissimus TaxID=426638 RepID=A0AAD3CJY9_9STRA|nr:hypothetical protein CTEN210_02984 [Chaetoceros tenuissimus]
MTSLTQEILDLEMQLKCIREGIIGDWKDETCLKALMNTVQSANKQIVDAFGQSLHRLGKFRPKESIVETVVTKFPVSMKNRNKNRLPIQSCMWNITKYGAKYIPLLAREGMKHNVGGEEKRGGLLTSDLSWNNGTYNTLQLVLAMDSSTGTGTTALDACMVKVLEILKRDSLLKKEDVTEYDLIIYGSQECCPLRFKYLLQLDLGALKGYTYGGKPLLHCLIDAKDLDRFKVVLKVTLELYPEEAGYLFQKHTDDQTAVEMAISNFGEKETMTALHEIISPSKQFAILHHALVHAPKTQTLFMQWFPWATNLRDHNNRSLIQAILAAGGKSVKENPNAFAFMSDDQICEKDPVTTLYPFAAVASGEDGDLEKSFYLLRRQPGVLDRSETRSVEQVTTADRKKKRKRGDSN